MILQLVFLHTFLELVFLNQCWRRFIVVPGMERNEHGKEGLICDQGRHLLFFPPFIPDK